MEAQDPASPKSRAEWPDRGVRGGQPQDVGLCQPGTTAGSSRRRQGAKAACSPPKTRVKPLIWRCHPCFQGEHPGSSQARGSHGHRPNTPCALASFLCFSSPFFTSPSPPEPHPFLSSGALENPFLPVNCSAQHPWEGMWGHPSTHGPCKNIHLQMSKCKC